MSATISANAADSAQRRQLKWASASFAGATQAITDPEVEIPALIQIASLTFKHRQAAAELRALDMRHRDFSARHECDDPAHEEFSQNSERLRYAIAGLNKALEKALQDLNQSIDLARIQAAS